MSTPHDWDDELGLDDEFEFSVDEDDQFDPFGLDDGDDLDDGQPPQVALLSDGSALRLTGPGAGSVVEADSSTATAVTRTVQTNLPTRDALLGGRLPILLMHRPHEGGTAVPGLLASIVAATKGQVGLGTVTPLPRSTLASNVRWLSECSAASLRIADPLVFRLDGAVLPCKPPSSRSRGWWPYLEADPVDVKDVLDAQRQVGANLLLSPGRGVDPADPQLSLDRAFAEADEALAALQTGERLALNLTLPRSWLSRPPLRDQLLAHLLDEEQFDVWYIRVQWSSNLRATEQPTDIELLSGYKRLAQLADDEERTLLLPQTGLTGWLQLAFGAAGFGSGLPGSDQAFKEPIGGGGGLQPIERYFEPTLLHTVERTMHDTLRARPGYVQCSCPYCPALHAAEDWRHGLAQMHLLHWTGRLAADAAGTGLGGANKAIRRAVRTAMSTASDEPLTGLSEPRHLAVWDRLL